MESSSQKVLSIKREERNDNHHDKTPDKYSFSFQYINYK